MRGFSTRVRGLGTRVRGFATRVRTHLERTQRKRTDPPASSHHMQNRHVPPCLVTPRGQRILQKHINQSVPRGVVTNMCLNCSVGTLCPNMPNSSSMRVCVRNKTRDGSLESTRKVAQKCFFQNICVFQLKVDRAMLAPARERRDHHQVPRLRTKVTHPNPVQGQVRGQKQIKLPKQGPAGGR